MRATFCGNEDGALRFQLLRGILLTAYAHFTHKLSERLMMRQILCFVFWWSRIFENFETGKRTTEQSYIVYTNEALVRDSIIVDYITRIYMHFECTHMITGSALDTFV